MRLPFLNPLPPRPTSPYFEGYLSATRLNTKSPEGGIVRMPANVYGTGSHAQNAFIEGVTDSTNDRLPRQPADRVSRAHPPWRLL